MSENRNALAPGYKAEAKAIGDYCDFVVKFELLAPDFSEVGWYDEPEDVIKASWEHHDGVKSEH